MIKRLLQVLILGIGSLSMTGQGNDTFLKYEIEESQPLGEALGELCDQLEIMLAFPANLVSDELIRPQSVSYTSKTELLEYLLQPYSLEIKKVSDTKYLIRDKILDLNPVEKNSFSGVILNEKDNQPIAFAAVYFNDYSEGTFTDDQGRFNITNNSSRADSLIISFVSHAPLTIALKDFKNNQSYTLLPDANVIEDVLVEYVVPPVLMNDFGNAMVFSQGVPLSQTVFNNDLLRQIQLLPGISAHNDDSAQLKIRGSNADQSRIVVDGMPLYRVDHYYGIFGAINTSFADKVSLYKNAQPIEYNSLGGGLLVIESDDSFSKTLGELHFNLLESGGQVKLPLGNKVSLNVAGRTSYRNVDDGGLINLKRNTDSQNFLDESVTNFIENEPQFRFYDLNTSLSMKLSDKSEISFNGFASNDRFINAFDLTFGGANNIQTETIYSNEEHWTNTAASVIWKQQFGDKLYFNLTNHYSNYGFSSLLDSELRRMQNGQIVKQELSIQNDSEIKDIGSTAFLASSFDRHNFKLGASYNYYSTDNLFRSENRNIINEDYNANLTSLFSSYILNSGKSNLELGGKYLMYRTRKRTDNYFSPQVNFSYKLDGQHLIKTSASRSYQFLREIDYETRQSQTIAFYTLAFNDQIPALRTDNFMVGYTYQASKFMIDLEFFLKDMEGVMQLTNIRPGVHNGSGNPDPPEYKLYRGERFVKGLDLMLSYKNKNYSAWLAYTLSQSLDSYKSLFKGESFASEDDRRHQVKWIQNYGVGRFTFTNNIIYASGRRFLSLDDLKELLDRNNLDARNLFNNLPDYFRVDLGVEYGFNIRKTEAQFGVSVFNIFNRQNLRYIQYAYRIEDQGPGGNLNSQILGAEAELLDRTVNLHFQLTF